MKKINQIVVLLACVLCATTFAQVKTPNGTSVDYKIFTAGNIALLESQAANWLSARGWTDSVTRIVPATGEYNCHSYAWYKSEGGSGNYWVNAFLNSDIDKFNPYYYYSQCPTPKNITKYWDDDSYIKVSENVATKVWYGSCWSWDNNFGWENLCDHSAIRITSGSNAGKYESKWGAWPRYIHPVDKSPYVTSNRWFFIKKPSINGPSSTCTTTTYNLSNGQAIGWRIYTGGSYDIIGITPTTATVKILSYNGQPAILEAEISNGVYVSKTINACQPSISGPANISTCSAEYTIDIPGNPNVVWSVTGGVLNGYGSVEIPFTLSNATNNSVTVNRPVGAWSPCTGTLTASFNGTSVTRQLKTATQPLYCNFYVDGCCSCTVELFLINMSGFINNCGNYIYKWDVLWNDCTWWELGRTNVPQFEIYIWSFENFAKYNNEGFIFRCIVDSFYTGQVQTEYAIWGSNYDCHSNYNCYDYNDNSASSYSQSKNYILAYPNPAGNILYIEIDALKAIQSMQSNISNRNTQSDLVFDIRLYDGQGNLLRQTTVKDGKTEFNINNLPNGIYYLHVHDGVNDKPELRQILVEH